MRIGICKSFEYAKDIKDAGFDYIEINLAKTCLLTDEEFLNSKRILDDACIAAKSANCFFPNDIRLTGEVDYNKINEYVGFALKRAHALGIELVVLGSGKARSIPDGFDKSVATEQFKKVVEICAKIGKKYGIKIAIEPLSQKDSNFLNTVRETAEFIESINSEDVGITADFFHMFMNGETMADFEYASKWIAHLHIAKPNENRHAPSVDDEKTLKEWADSIKNIGYNGNMSLESTSKQDFNEALCDMNSIKHIFE